VPLAAAGRLWAGTARCTRSARPIREAWALERAGRIPHFAALAAILPQHMTVHASTSACGIWTWAGHNNQRCETLLSGGALQGPHGLCIEQAAEQLPGRSSERGAMTTPKSARGSRACEELCDLSFRHVGYRLRRGGANNGAIDILQDVTGSIRSTALTAILGSSGAGCGLPPWRAAGRPSAQQPRCARPPTDLGGLTGAAWRAGRRRWCGPGPVLASCWWEVSGCRAMRPGTSSPARPAWPGYNERQYRQGGAGRPGMQGLQHVASCADLAGSYSAVGLPGRARPNKLAAQAASARSGGSGAQDSAPIRASAPA